MIKKIALTALTASALMLSTQASAMTGVYVHGNAGYAAQTGGNIPNATGIGNMSRSNNHFGWDAFLGYNMDMDEQWGLGGEVGYGRFGRTTWKDNTTDTSAEVDQSAWMLLAVATLHADEQFDVFAKAGASFGHSDFDATDGHAKESSTSTSTMPMIALGAAYNVMPELGVTLTWEHIFGNKIDGDSFNNDDGKLKSGEFQTVNTFMLGFKYTFEV